MKHAAFVTSTCELAFLDMPSLQESLFDYINKNCIVSIKFVSEITAQQHKLYRGFLLPQILEAIELQGIVRFPEDVSKRQKLEVVHQLLKKMFLNSVLQNGLGMPLEIVKSMSSLNKEQTEIYFSQIGEWYGRMFKKSLIFPDDLITKEE